MALMIQQRLLGYVFPLWMIGVAVYAMTRVFFELVTLHDISDILSPNWIIKKREEESGLPALDSEAYGTVVEIGPGSGNQLSRYDKSKIRKVYGIEPNKDLHEALRKTIKAEDLEGIYEIVPYGVEDFERLKEYGISEGSVDTVMSISVLCSVPRPQEMTKAMYKLLKPGGQMLVHEHIASVDPVSGFVQDFYDIVWPHLFGGCQLRRPTNQYLLAAGKWQKVDVEPPTPEDDCVVFPKIVGKFIKAK